MQDIAEFKPFNPTIKGHFKIELHNAKTGELEHCVEGDNHFNYGCLNGLQRSVFYNFMHSGKKTRYFSVYSMPNYALYVDNIQNNIGIAFMVLSEQDATEVIESANAPCYPSSGTLKAYAYLPSADTSPNAEKGVYNATDSYISPTEMQIICDWTTEKGNGTFNSISLLRGYQDNSIADDYDWFILSRVPYRIYSQLTPDCKPIASYRDYFYLPSQDCYSPDKTTRYYVTTNYIKSQNLSTGVISDFISSAECALYANYAHLTIDQYATGHYDIAYKSNLTTVKVFNKTLSGETFIGTLAISGCTIVYNVFIYNRIMTVIYRTDVDNTIRITQYRLTGGTLTDVIGTNSISSTSDAIDYSDMWAYIPTTSSSIAYIYSVKLALSDGVDIRKGAAALPMVEYKINLISGEIASIETGRTSKYFIPHAASVYGVARMYIWSMDPTTYFVAATLQKTCYTSFDTTENLALAVELLAPPLSTRNLPYNPIAMFSQTFTPFTKANTQTMKVTYTISISEA